MTKSPKIFDRDRIQAKTTLHGGVKIELGPKLFYFPVCQVRNEASWLIRSFPVGLSNETTSYPEVWSVFGTAKGLDWFLGVHVVVNLLQELVDKIDSLEWVTIRN